jgi:uncharacterized protein
MEITMNTNHRIGSLAVLWIVFIAIELVGCADREPSFVEDRMGLLNDIQRQHIEAFHQSLWNDLGIYFYLVILDEPADDLLQTAVEIYDERLVKEQAAGENGLLLLVDPLGRRVRLEVGYGLEWLFPDAFVGYVERDQMGPFFAEARLSDGVEATVELLVSRAHGNVELETLAAPTTAITQGSGGAGAGSVLPLNGGNNRAPAIMNPDEFAPGETPLESLQVYMQILKQGIKNPDLPIYTGDTRQFLSKWLVTDAQQHNELKGISRHLSSAEERISGNLAVVRFPISVRTEAPYFFRKSPDGWQLDLSSMNRLIRFNHLNQWHFTESDHEFMFAFSENRTDANGYIR